MSLSILLMFLIQNTYLNTSVEIIDSGVTPWAVKHNPLYPALYMAEFPDDHISIFIQDVILYFYYH